MIKGIIFDLDGVVFDTESKRFLDLKRVLKKYGYSLNKSDFSDMLGKKTKVYVQEKIPALTKAQAEKIAEERRKIQERTIKDDKLIKGILGILKYLKTQKFKIGITTGSRRRIVNKLIKIHKLTNYFDAIVTGEDYKTIKNNPECYRITANRLGLKPSEIIVIEDASNGIKAAKKLGCKTFGLKTSVKGNELDMADKVFDTATEIKQYLISHHKH